MHSKDKLADELRQAGLIDMSVKAAQGYYHDFLSPLETPCLQLEADLRDAGTPAAEALRQRHINGEFDATEEESEAWARSEKGQATIARLTEEHIEKTTTPPGNKTYRECMAEIIGVLKKYDMAGAITIVSKERSMFKYFFPNWSVITVEPSGVRFRAKKEDFATKEAQREAVELSVGIILEMRYIAQNTINMTQAMAGKLAEHMDIVHDPDMDFDPELDN